MTTAASMQRGGSSPAVVLTLALGGCAMHTLHVQAPDVVNPVSMSNAVSTDVARSGATVGTLLTTLWSVEERMTLPGPYATVTTTQRRAENRFQEALMERVKGSQRRAVKDVEIQIESSSINVLFVRTGEGLTVEIRGTVVELQ